MTAMIKKTPMKKWVNAKKTTIDGITFDSGRESDMYRLLKEANLEFDYIGGENAKYPILDELKYEGECYERAQKRSKEMKNTSKVSGAGYTPDFRAKDESWFIEVKGRKLGDFSMRWKLFKAFLSSRDPKPMLFMPVTLGDCIQVVNILKDKRDETKEK